MASWNFIYIVDVLGNAMPHPLWFRAKKSHKLESQLDFVAHKTDC